MEKKLNQTVRPGISVMSFKVLFIDDQNFASVVSRFEIYIYFFMTRNIGETV